VFGPIRVTQAFIPLLQRSSAPVIVNVSSGLGSETLVSLACSSATARWASPWPILGRQARLVRPGVGRSESRRCDRWLHGGWRAKGIDWPCDPTLERRGCLCPKGVVSSTDRWWLPLLAEQKNAATPARFCDSSAAILFRRALDRDPLSRRTERRSDFGP
jgi:hypothetical protein